MSFTLIKNVIKNTVVLRKYFQNVSRLTVSSFNNKDIHTTKNLNDLMEFFDLKKNWAESDIKVGRAWKLDELRIKSNSDLHKLWYVLLKERNMLYTMQHECEEQVRLFPNPERIDKVQESMNNIETVVRERNVSYYKLETGETGERPVEDIVNLIGLPEKYEKKEYFMPKFMNSRWIKPYLDHGYTNSCAILKFRKLYNEKIYREKRKERNRDYNHVQHLFKRFPNMDIEAVKAEYPNVNVERARQSRKARGHYFPKF